MYYKILLILAVCLNSALTENCTNAQSVQMSLELFECCRNNESYQIFLEDPCIKDAGEKQLSSIQCMKECFYTEHKLMVNDTIVLENVQLYLQPLTDEADRNRFINAAEFCDKFGKKKIVEKFAHLQMGAECRGYYMLFDMCVSLNAITRCPETRLTKSDYCTSQIQFLNECVFSG